MGALSWLKGKHAQIKDLTRNATVFPVPVLALARTSFPEKHICLEFTPSNGIRDTWIKRPKLSSQQREW